MCVDLLRKIPVVGWFFLIVGNDVLKLPGRRQIATVGTGQRHHVQQSEGRAYGRGKSDSSAPTPSADAQRVSV